MSLWHRLRLGVVSLVLLVAGAAAGFFFARLHPLHPKLPDLGAAPHYRLTNQLGQPVSSQDFAGKVQVVTFLFPYCTTYCPLITAHLIGFEHLLEGDRAQNRVQLVAFNVAPGSTGPQQMREFLSQYGWDPHDPHWQYLTGTPAQIRRVVTGGFHIAYQRVADKGSEPPVLISPSQSPQLSVANPLAARVQPDFDVEHNDAIVLVDARGRIRRIYENADVVSPRRLWADLQPLLRAAALEVKAAPKR